MHHVASHLNCLCIRHLEHSVGSSATKEPKATAVKALNLNHWTAREFPALKSFLSESFCLFPVFKVSSSITSPIKSSLSCWNKINHPSYITQTSLKSVYFWRNENVHLEIMQWLQKTPFTLKTCHVFDCFTYNIRLKYSPVVWLSFHII